MPPLLRIAALGLALAWAGLASAQTAPGAPAATAQEIEQREAGEAADRAARVGPADVTLLDQGQLKLPEGYVFVPQPEAGRFLRAYGGVPSPNLVGLVLPAGDGDWLSIVSFQRSGYVRDDDARNWNADELLTNLKEGTAEANKERAARGFPALEVRGWVEKPAYDAATHRLVWSALVVRQDGSGTESVNYNTYALGRDGYLSLNLISSAARIEGDKPNAHALLAAIAYAPGKRYEDFNASTDPVAAYGLAALVGGAAVAKKLGLFGVIAAVFAKFGKLAVLGLGALAAGVVGLFRRRKASPEA